MQDARGYRSVCIHKGLDGDSKVDRLINASTMAYSSDEDMNEHSDYGYIVAVRHRVTRNEFYESTSGLIQIFH